MTVGSLGDVLFYVNDGEVRTIKEASWRQKANYSTHKILGKRTLLEYTGMDASEISLTVTVSVFLGSDPLISISAVSTLLESGDVVPLILGTDVIGTGWVVTDLETKMNYFGKDGTLYQAELTIKIKEYGNVIEESND